MVKFHIKSFATRLSIYIISFSTIIFMAVMAIFYTYNRDVITRHAVERTHGELKNMASQVDALLSSVENTVRHSVWLVERNLANPDSLYGVVEAVAKDNDLIVGSGIAFEPFYYKEKGRYFMPYAFLRDGKATRQSLGGKEYDYHCMDWYLIPKFLKKNYWSEPYYDEGGGNIIMSTYACPLFDEDGRMYAVFTANISLSQFTDMVDALKPYESSRSFLLSRNGSYLTHPDRKKIMNETVLTDAFEKHDAQYERLGREMIAGRTGTIRLKHGGLETHALYTAIPNIGWSVCNICEDKVILHELAGTSRWIVGLFMAGMVLLFISSYLIIKRVVRPLEQFSGFARIIATGRFDAVLPEVRSLDEMKDLHDSFAYMQQSLSEYVAELKATTTAKERIESELSIAREIQMGMIPKTFPPFPERSDVDLHAILKPAKEVGGDLYDFFLDNGKLYFAIGDVSGKGVPASLFMAITRSLFHTLSGHMDSPAVIMNSMNDAISQSNDSSMFVTLFIGILDLETGTLRYCNAGHNAPVLIRPDGRAAYMDIKTNLVVGIMGKIQYQEEEISLERGTKLFLYTDGVTEAENGNKEFYSEERLLQTIARNASHDVCRMIDETLQSVDAHVHGAEQSDDLTMLVIHYKSKQKRNGEGD